MNKYQLSLCGYEEKKKSTFKRAVLGAILTTIVGNVAFREVQVVVKPPLLLGGEIVAGREDGFKLCWLLFSVDGYIFADVRPETTRRVAETYLARSSRLVFLASYSWGFSWIVCF